MKCMTMIDLSKIRSIKTLESMRRDLSDFLNFDAATMKAVYVEEFEWSEDDYEADRDAATYLLEQVERRMRSLGRHLSKVGTSADQQSD